MAHGASAGDPAADQKLAWEKGQLRQLLHSPDYNLFPNSTVFESDFVQVTKKGKWVDFTNMPTIVSVGVTSSDPCLPLPNVLLIARRKVLDKGFAAGDSKTPAQAPRAELIRLLPLRHVQLSVHHAAQRILRLQTVTQKVYYLQLHRDHPKAVFRLWSRLANILRRGLSSTPKDPAIRLQHSLVPRGAGPSGSSSGEAFFSEAGGPRGGQRAGDQPGRRKKAPSGVPGQPGLAQAARSRRKESGASPKRVSFQQLPTTYGVDVRRDLPAAPRSDPGLLHDTPLLLMCTQCEGRLPQPSEEPPSSGQHRGAHQLPPQESLSWLQPLSRLWRSTREAAGRK